MNHFLYAKTVQKNLRSLKIIYDKDMPSMPLGMVFDFPKQSTQFPNLEKFEYSFPYAYPCFVKNLNFNCPNIKHISFAKIDDEQNTGIDDYYILVCLSLQKLETYIDQNGNLFEIKGKNIKFTKKLNQDKELNQNRLEILKSDLGRNGYKLNYQKDEM
jgi:hypothetical protein